MDAKKVNYKYLYNDSPDTIVHQYSISRQNKDTVYWQKTYVNDELQYETIFLIKGGRKILKREVYHSDGTGYLQAGSYNGRIIFLDEIDDGKIYKKVEAKVVFEDPDGFKYISEDETSFVGKVYLSWNDTVRTALKFSYNMQTRETSYYTPFISRNQSSSKGYIYFVKGVGFLKRQVVHEDGLIDDMNLVSIEIHR
jgi:hypothetical protein